MGIEPTHRLLGGAQDLKSWEGTSPQPLPRGAKNFGIALRQFQGRKGQGEQEGRFFDPQRRKKMAAPPLGFLPQSKAILPLAPFLCPSSD